MAYANTKSHNKITKSGEINRHSGYKDSAFELIKVNVGNGNPWSTDRYTGAVTCMSSDDNNTSDNRTLTLLGYKCQPSLRGIYGCDGPGCS